MTELDLSSMLTPRGMRRLLIGGASLAAAAAAGLLIAAPALANDSSKPATPLVACTTDLVTPCSVDVTPPTAPSTDYLVTLPGIGSLTVTLDASGAIKTATVSALTGFTASPVEINEDANRVSLTITSATNPTKVFEVKVAVKPSATGGAPTVTAKVKAGEVDNDTNEQNEDKGEHEGANTLAVAHTDKHEHGGGGGGD